MWFSVVEHFLFNVSYNPLNIVPISRMMIPVFNVILSVLSVINIIVNIRLVEMTLLYSIFSCSSIFENKITQNGIINVISVPFDIGTILNPIT